MNLTALVRRLARICRKAGKFLRSALTVVHRPFSLFTFVPCGNIQGAKFAVEARRHAVHHAHLDGELVAGVRVRVDESGRDHMVFRIHHFLATNRFVRDRDNLAVLDADVSDTIELCLRVHHPAVQDDDVVVLRTCRWNEQDESCHDGMDAAHVCHG